ncbi:MSHA biogenesis protein MshN [Colwellia sp. 75C3]|uniref:tetratricopeptide repeat protein n=1 Tax=Colwellia sp. 75C3 TaxID=888425 RepID=UPI000C32FA35|nr:tetratricopeptide repeat protein [Colwellia sp. 75C3]PKG85253.1 MSHA biogenesis protein MshN [Colwellia sp. 75C3]
MSVINQMLKDLDQRSPEPNSQTVQPEQVSSIISPKKIALITGTCVFAVCVISFYFWQLISENNALKAEKVTSNAAHQVSTQLSTQSSNQVITNQVNSSVNAVQSSPVNQAMRLETNENKTARAPIAAEEFHYANEQSNEQENQQAIVATKTDVSGPRDLAITATENRAENNAQRIAAKPVVNNSSSRVIPAKKTVAIADGHSHSAAVSSHSHDVDSASTNAVTKAATTESKSKKNKMSVSRRQLSADELADQKLALAEKALAAKQINKAEKLLEEVVIIKPSDSQTRKKLAALWFGRQAYQDAVNLLSQGIALNGKDSSLRQMKARIHLKQGQVTAALNSLKPLAQLKDEQYQIMLANTAQQAQQNNVAVEAYKVLIAMQPDIGRWYLGLAVLHDKSSQFTLASVAYNQALTKNDLSVASVNFVEQRIQAIGQ